jgi:hypothetical protein
MLGGLGGCTTLSSSGDPLADFRDRSRGVPQRVACIGPARAQAAGDPARLAAVNAALDTAAWESREPFPVRAAAIRTLLSDPDPAVYGPAKAKAAVALPREPSREVVQSICDIAAERGWTDLVPAIIRSYSRVVPMVPDEHDRSERRALEQLHPGRGVDDVILQAFANPPLGVEAGEEARRAFRADAWDALARLDRDGVARRHALPTLTYDPGDRTMAAIAACLRDLRALPLTGEEIRWAESLQDPAKPANAAWWSQAASAIAQVHAQDALSLRHAEIIRWAASNRPQWLAASREQLLREAHGRFDGREHYARTADPDAYRPRDRMGDAERRVTWADLLSLLVLDDAVHSPAVVASIFAHAGLDQKDETTEYGGILNLAPAGSEAVLYPPRPAERQGDTRFIASRDMIAASDRSAAHYHFHVQRWRNSDLAGPSTGDLEYAQRFGRACLVFTGVKEGVLAVDYYQPDGVVVDIGTIRSP